jgi:surfeit locus 1 family protein
MGGMYRFLVTPKWLFGHALFLSVLVLFPALGFWQVGRHAQTSAQNELIEARLNDERRPVEELLAAPGPQDAAALEFRRVSATGVFRPSEEVLLTGTTDGGRPGHHVLTPLDLRGGGAILVNRGWVPFALDTPPVADAAPPSGEVTVDGVLIAGDPTGRVRAPAPGDERVLRLPSVDPPVIAAQTSGDLPPVYVQASRVEGVAEDALPHPAPAVEASETGTHLSYAVQWFAFTAVALIGYPLLVWRTARDRRAGEGSEARAPDALVR